MRKRHCAYVLLLIAFGTIGGCPPQVPTGNAKVSGKLVLPEGVSQNGFKVMSAAGAGDIETNGGFSITLPAPGRPALVLVNDSAGQVVLFGFLNSAGGANTVSPRDSVVALLFLGLGGFSLPAEVQSSALELISQQPVVDTLTETLEPLMVENLGVLREGNESFTAALVAGVKDLSDMKFSAQKRSQQAREFGPPLGSLNVYQQTQSGIDVVQADDPGSVLVKNSYRRRSLVYVYKTATQIEGQDKKPVSPAQRMGEPIRMDSTQSFGTLLSLFQQAFYLATGTNESTAYVPKSIGPIELPADPDVDKTFFEVVAAGAGFHDTAPTTGNPELTNDSRFPQSERDEWIQTARDYDTASFVFDVFLPGIDTLLGGVLLATKPDLASDVQIAVGVIGELQSAYNLLDRQGRDVVLPGYTVVPANFVALIAIGNWRPVTEATLRLFFTSPGAREAVLGRMSVSLSGAGIAFIESVGTINTALSLIFASGDITAVLHDITSSQNINAWEIAEVRNRVVLTPKNPAVTADAQVDFKVEIPGINDGQELAYVWSVSGAIGGVLSDANHSSLPSFETTSNAVTYKLAAGANPAADATDEVKVQVYAVNGIVLNEVGTASTTVTFSSLRVSIQPAEVTISGSTDRTPLSVVVDGAPAGTRFAYGWQVPSGAYGGIEDSHGPVGTSTEEASVDYALNGHPALQPVTETLSVLVTIVDDNGFFRSTAGTAQTKVTIQPKPCDGSDGTPVFTGCGFESSWPPSNRMGEDMTITFKQHTGGICGGTYTIYMNMPGEFVSATGGTINGQTASFPDPGSDTNRTAVYRLSANPAEYDGLRTCPRALGYYEFPSADTGPYIYITNGAHDLLPYVVNP